MFRCFKKQTKYLIQKKETQNPSKEAEDFQALWWKETRDLDVTRKYHKTKRMEHKGKLNSITLKVIVQVSLVWNCTINTHLGTERRFILQTKLFFFLVVVVVYNTHSYFIVCNRWECCEIEQMQILCLKTF